MTLSESIAFWIFIVMMVGFLRLGGLAGAPEVEAAAASHDASDGP